MSESHGDGQRPPLNPVDPAAMPPAGTAVTRLSAAPPDDGGVKRPEPRRRKLRLLYIYPDTVGLPADPARNLLHHLSQRLEGDFLLVWIADRADAASRASGIAAASGSFGVHWQLRSRAPAVLRRLLQILFHVRTAVRMQRVRGRYDAILVHGPFAMAVSGLILRRLLRVPLIVEFPGHPFKAFDFSTGNAGRIKRWIAPRWTGFVARRADHVRLLYPSQLDDLNARTEGRTSVFHDFTTVSSVQPARRAPADPPFILFLGFPFYLKGVDLLLRAFLSIAEQFPEHRLVVAGFCHNPAEWQALGQHHPRISFPGPLPHAEAMSLMATCSAFVLPSRTEAMGRVLLEAMAYGRPIVASAVDGIPHYVKDGDTGLLFRENDAEDLARQLCRLLRDGPLAMKLGQRAREVALDRYSEARYAEEVALMVARAARAGQEAGT
jgi:glycosyltransferase involved in cell wall biosynthesis